MTTPDHDPDLKRIDLNANELVLLLNAIRHSKGHFDYHRKGAEFEISQARKVLARARTKMAKEAAQSEVDRHVEREAFHKARLDALTALYTKIDGLFRTPG